MEQPGQTQKDGGATSANGQRKLTFDDLVARVIAQKQEKIIQLRELAAKYKEVVGVEDSTIKKRIGELESACASKIIRLKAERQRFGGLMGASDSELVVQGCNERNSAESDDLYENADEQIRKGIRERKLSESDYFGAVFPLEEKHRPAAGPSFAEYVVGVRVREEGEEEEEEDEQEERRPSNYKVLISGINRRLRDSLDYFIAKNPEVMQALMSDVPLDEETAKAILGHFHEFLEAEQGIVRHNASALALIIGIGVRKAERYLGDLSKPQLIELALAAKREELYAPELIEIDILLRDEDVYIARLRDSLALCRIRDMLNRLIGEHLGTPEKEAATQDVESLEALWSRILKKNGGDVEKARAEYQAAVEARMMAESEAASAGFVKKKPLESEPGPAAFVMFGEEDAEPDQCRPFSVVSKYQIVKMFELFCYDRNLLQEFADYFEENFPLAPDDWESRGEPFKLTSYRHVPAQINEILRSFICSKEGYRIFNEKSRYFRKLMVREEDPWADAAGNERVQDWINPENHPHDFAQALRIRDRDEETARRASADSQSSGSMFRDALQEVDK